MATPTAGRTTRTGTQTRTKSGGHRWHRPCSRARGILTEAAMEPTDITIEILKDIRTGVQQTNERIDHLSGRIDHLSGRIDQTNEDLSGRLDTLTRRVVESEIRTSTAITALAGSIQEMTLVLRASHDLRPRVERCELDIAELRRRLP